MTLSANSDVSLSDAEPSPVSVAKGDAQPDLPADAATRRKRVWGCAILIALALATPVLLLVAAYVALIWSGDRQADEAIARAKAAGDPVTLADMATHYPTSPEIEEATRHWLLAVQIVGDPTFESSSSKLPLFDGSAFAVGSTIAPEDVAEATAFLAKYREAIEEAHTARAAGSVARYPIDFADGIAMQLTHAQDLRGLVRLLELDLEMKLLTGDVDGAVENLLSMVAASESLTNEPLLISQLVRIATFSLSAKALERLLQRHDLTDEQLANLQQAFARQDFPAGLRRSLQGEQFFLIHTMEGDLAVGNAEIDWARALPFRGGDLSKGLDLWRKVIDASEEGSLETLEAARAMEDEIKAVAGNGIDRFRYPMTTMLLPAIDSATGAFLRGEAIAKVATTAVASERYRLKQGSFPATLADLPPDLLPETPLDPFDGKPLRYVVDESGALIYSIGSDQLDDGGLDDPSSGDLPFRLIDDKSDAAQDASEGTP